MYTQDAVRRRVIARQEMLETWEANGDFFVGPYAAAKQAMRVAGLRGDLTRLVAPSGASISPLDTAHVFGKLLLEAADRQGDEKILVIGSPIQIHLTDPNLELNIEFQKRKYLVVKQGDFDNLLFYL